MMDYIDKAITLAIVCTCVYILVGLLMGPEALVAEDTKKNLLAPKPGTSQGAVVDVAPAVSAILGKPQMSYSGDGSSVTDGQGNPMAPHDHKGQCRWVQNIVDLPPFNVIGPDQRNHRLCAIKHAGVSRFGEFRGGMCYVVTNGKITASPVFKYLTGACSVPVQTRTACSNMQADILLGSETGLCFLNGSFGHVQKEGKYFYCKSTDGTAVQSACSGFSYMSIDSSVNLPSKPY